MSLPSGKAISLLKSLECTPDDLQHLNPEERAEYVALSAQIRQVNGKLSRLKLTAAMRRLLPTDKLGVYDALVAEKDAILLRMRNSVSDPKLIAAAESVAATDGRERSGETALPFEQDPEIQRLRLIGHELNGLVAMAYLRAVVQDEVQCGGPGDDIPQNLRQSA